MKRGLVGYSDSEEEGKVEEEDSLTAKVGKKAKKEGERKREKKMLEEEIRRIEKEKEEEEYDKWKLKEDEFLKRQLVEQ